MPLGRFLRSWCWLSPWSGLMVDIVGVAGADDVGYREKCGSHVVLSPACTCLSARLRREGVGV